MLFAVLFSIAMFGLATQAVFAGCGGGEVNFDCTGYSTVTCPTVCCYWENLVGECLARTCGSVAEDKCVSCGCTPPISTTTTTVVPAGFNTTVNPTTRTIAKGQTTTYIVTFTSSGGFSGSVEMISLNGCPLSSTCTFNPASISMTAGSHATSTLAVVTTASTPVGTHNIAANWRSGTVEKLMVAELTVTATALSTTTSPTTTTTTTVRSTTSSTTTTIPDRVTIDLYAGQNAMGIPGLTVSDFSSCTLDYFTGEGGSELTTVEKPFIYWDALGKRYVYKLNNFEKMTDGAVYFIPMKSNKCTITVPKTPLGSITLRKGQNIVFVTYPLEKDDIDDICGDDFLDYFVSQTGTQLSTKEEPFLFLDTKKDSIASNNKWAKTDKMEPYAGYAVPVAAAATKSSCTISFDPSGVPFQAII